MTIKPVAQWAAYDDAAAAVRADLPKDYEISRAMVEDDDHWHGGDGWPGHRTGDRVVDATRIARIEPQFVSDNVTGEMVENRTNGLIGQEADIHLDPLKKSKDEKVSEQLAAEALTTVAALAPWWDRVKLWEKVALACDRVSYARRGAVRPFVAEGHLQLVPSENGVPASRTLPKVGTLAEALALIDLDAPPPGMAVRYVDPVTQRPAAVVLGKDGDKDKAEVWTVNPATKATEVRVFIQGGDAPAPVPVDLGGRLPFGEMRGSRIVTESLRRTQALLNFIMTVTGRTVETAGFRERHVTNAEPHLLWLTSRPANTPVLKTQKTESGVDILWGVAEPPVFGAGFLNEWQGLETKGPNNEQTIATPGITVVDPVDPAFATNAADAVTARLYKRAKQGHLGLAKTGETSGTAYQQARAQFESDLKRLKSPCEGMIRDVLEAVLALAGQMCDEAKGILDRFRVVVDLHISAGPITPEDATLATTLRDARAISTQTMMARVGVEDPVAEQAAIDADPLMRADYWTKMSAAMNALTAYPDMTAAGAGHLLGLTAEQVAVFETGQPPAVDEGAPRLVA